MRPKRSFAYLDEQWMPFWPLRISILLLPRRPMWQQEYRNSEWPERHPLLVQISEGSLRPHASLRAVHRSGATLADLEWRGRRRCLSMVESAYGPTTPAL